MSNNERLPEVKGDQEEFSREAILADIRQTIDKTIKAVPGLADFLANLPKDISKDDKRVAILHQIPRGTMRMVDLIFLDPTTLDTDLTDLDLQLWDKIVNRKGEVGISELNAIKKEDQGILLNKNRTELYVFFGNEVWVMASENL